MDKERVEKSVKAFIKYLNDLDISKLTEEEKQDIIYINDLCKTNEEINDMMYKIKISNSEIDRLNVLKDYFLNEEVKNAKTEEELISKTFGINIEDIEHRKLNTGKDVFVVYGDTSGRKRIIENPKDKESLVEFLKEEQNNNKDYQTENYKANSKDILYNQLNTTDLELKVVPAREIYKYTEIINSLDEKIRICLTEIIKNIDKLNIEYINLENAVALDKDGNLIEAVYNLDERKVDLQEPKEYSYNSTEMSNEDNNSSFSDEDVIYSTNDEVMDEEENNIENNEFEDIPEIVEAEGIEGEKKEEVIRNMKKYYKNPDAMLSLPPEERMYYERLNAILAEKIEQRKKNTNRNVMTLKNNQNNFGFSNIFLISVVLIVISIVLFIVLK